MKIVITSRGDVVLCADVMLCSSHRDCQWQIIKFYFNLAILGIALTILPMIVNVVVSYKLEYFLALTVTQTGRAFFVFASNV